MDPNCKNVPRGGQATVAANTQKSETSIPEAVVEEPGKSNKEDGWKYTSPGPKISETTVVESAMTESPDPLRFLTHPDPVELGNDLDDVAMSVKHSFTLMAPLYDGRGK